MGTTLDHLQELGAASPTTKLLVLTGWPIQQTMLDALEAGATGYLSKTRPLADLVEAVHRVARRETVIDPDLLDALVRTDAAAPRPSSRELAVLEHLARGSTSGEIATAMHLSPHTVRGCVTSLLRTLEVHSRVEAVGEGIRRGLITPSGPG